MARRKQRYFVGARVDAVQQASVDHGARIRGLSRSEYVRNVVIEAAREDIQRALAEGDPATEKT